jgi:hypothetical protein
MGESLDLSWLCWCMVNVVWPRDPRARRESSATCNGHGQGMVDGLPCRERGSAPPEGTQTDLRPPHSRPPPVARCRCRCRSLEASILAPLMEHRDLVLPLTVSLLVLHNNNVWLAAFFVPKSSFFPFTFWKVSCEYVSDNRREPGVCIAGASTRTTPRCCPT